MSWPDIVMRLAELLALAAVPCPQRMVRLDARVCVDRLPYPNNDDEWPLLGVSGVREDYLEDDGLTWDAVSLCEEQGKRLCTAREWARACEGTPPRECPPMYPWIQPDWHRVMVRDGDELARLDQHGDPHEWPDCASSVGAMFLGNLEEWVMAGDGPRLTYGFWSRPASCTQINRTHVAAWHGYATAARCCHDVRLP